ncbi:hypothetical protein D3C84_742770 [compost metagenome]
MSVRFYDVKGMGLERFVSEWEPVLLAMPVLTNQSICLRNQSKNIRTTGRRSCPGTHTALYWAAGKRMSSRQGCSNPRRKLSATSTLLANTKPCPAMAACKAWCSSS